MKKIRLLLMTALATIVAAVSTGAYAQLTWSGTQTLTAGQNITQNITLTGDVTINVASGTAIIRGTISGNYSLTKTGGGGLDLAGENTYSGVTTISAGELNIGTGGATGGSIAGNIINNNVLTFRRSTDYVYAGVISGSGYIIKVSGNKVTLTGANTYSGRTIVNGGTLQIGNGTSGSINNTLDVLLENYSTLRFESGGIFDKIISGSGQVVVNSRNGILNFIADNTYTGTTTIEGGRLCLGFNYGTISDGTTGSIAGNIVINKNAELEFNRSNEYTYSGVISGEGAVVKGNSNKVILNGANTLTGGIYIYGGTLALGSSGSLESSYIEFSSKNTAKFDVSAGNKKVKWLHTVFGDLTDGEVILGSSTLTIGTEGQGAVAGSYHGIFTGTGGSVTKTGTGTFYLRNTGNTATGTFTCVQGTVDFSGKWAGNFVKQSGSTLTVTGNPTVGGTLTMQGGTTYMNLSGTPSRISASGALSASGANTLNITGGVIGTNYTLISAASGVSAAPFSATSTSGTLSATTTALTFTPAPPIVPVTGITDVPTMATATIPLTLSGTVAPSNASNRAIAWSVIESGGSGASISGSTFNAIAAGTVTVRATITNGKAAGVDYTQDFTIIVVQTGTYTGNLQVESAGLNIDETVSGVSVEMKAGSPAGFYNFAFDELNLFEGSGMPAFELKAVKLEGNTLSKTGSESVIVPEITIPDGIPLIGGQTFYNVNVTITLEDGSSVIDNVLTLKLKLSAPVIPPLFNIDIFVTFTGTIHKPQIRYVKPGGTGDGSSWTNASGNIQAMINASTVGDQVWIAGGTYSLTATLEMKNGVNVYGSFAGDETSPAERLPNKTVYPWPDAWVFDNPTILDGQKARRVLYQPAAFTVETVFDGLTITNGNSYHSSSATSGSGAYIQTKGKLINCIVKDNKYDAYPNVSGGSAFGGGVYNFGGTISKCLITGNQIATSAWQFPQTVQGGGIYNAGGIVTECTISGNTAKNESSSSNCTSTYGGGIYNAGGTITRCTVSGNTVSIPNNSAYAFAYGGGIACSSTALGIISECTVEDNVTGGPGEGAGIYNGKVRACKITGNKTSTFSGVSGKGGGLSQCIADNCLILGNKANTEGGGIYEGETYNCTVVYNSATVKGGGLYGGKATNSIFWNNSAAGFTTHVESQCSGSTANPNYIFYTPNIRNCAIQFFNMIVPTRGNIGLNDINDVTSGQDDIYKAPFFEDPSKNNFRLQAGSACRDRGDNSIVTEEFMELSNGRPRDLTGYPRISFGTVDMGAYEYQAPLSVGAQNGLSITGVSDQVKYTVAMSYMTKGTFPIALNGVSPSTIWLQNINMNILNDTYYEYPIGINVGSTVAAGTYPVSITINGVTSNVFNLVVHEASYPVNFSVLNDDLGGKITATVNGTQIQSGDLVKTGSKVEIKLIPDDGALIEYFSVNGSPVTGDTYTIESILQAYYIEAQFRLTKGKCGDKLFWEVTENADKHILTISGTGDMYDFDSGVSSMSNSPWKYYQYSIEKVIIGDGATSIGKDAFSGYMNLTTLTFGKGLINIADNAFRWSGLATVTLPNNVTTIGDGAFSGCYNLTTVTVGSNVSSIGNDAFSNCSNLANMYSKAMIPPVAYNSNTENYSGTFFGANVKVCVLHVPTGTRTAYAGADGWQEFTNISADITNIIAGAVFTSGKDLAAGKVSLYRKVSSDYELLQTQTLREGLFGFTDLATGNYILKATPENSADGLPTYYTKAAIWQDATAIQISFNANQTADITLLTVPALSSGNSSLSGYVYDGTGGMKSASALRSSSENPAADVNVYLQQQQGSNWVTVAATVSDADGYYEFSNLPAGTYRVVLDIPGLGTINDPKTIELPENGTVGNVDIEIRNNGIYNITAIPFIKADNKTIQVYPNPTKGMVYINTEGDVMLKLYNPQGKQLLETIGNTIDLSSFDNGLYILQVNGKVVKVVKK